MRSASITVASRWAITMTVHPSPAMFGVHLRFGDGVEAAGGLVEQKDPRLRGERSSQRQPLALTTRQRRARVDERGLPSHRHGADVVGDAGQRGGGLEPFQRQTGVAEGEVVADRQAEDVRVLGDDPDLGPHAARVQVARSMPSSRTRPADGA